MKVKMLIENKGYQPNIKSKHGLAMYIETGPNKILFDLGPKSDSLLTHNAAVLNVNIKSISTAIISHGHADHGGGLKAFLESNNKASIYVHKDSFNPFYTSILGYKYFIGLDSDLKSNKRLIFTENKYEITENMILFTSNNKSSIELKSNASLLQKCNSTYKADQFTHEQNLIIKEKNKYILVAGCAHNGIVNIINQAEDICGTELDYVIAGFHLYNPVTKKTETKNIIKTIADKLKLKKTVYYTCHCTGSKAFRFLKSYLGEQIHYLSCGSVLNL